MFSPHTRLLPRISLPAASSLLRASYAAVRSPLMAMQNHSDSPQETHMGIDPKTMGDYPIPLSPPLPSISKDIELGRAMSASSRSSVFTLSRKDVLFEDEWLIAINKPSGVYCEAILSSVPSLLNNDSTDSLRLGTQSNKLEFHLANRLDRDTSGVTVITKSHKIAAKLVKAFTNHKVRKTYIAFCVGKAPNWSTITIKSGHGRSKFGAWRVYAASDVGRILPGGSSVRDMETRFEILTVNGQECHQGLTEVEKDANNFIVEEKSTVKYEENISKDEILVRAYPQSGRTHQIRLHCQYLGISIRGDVKYEGVCEWKGIIYDGHELHAESLSFDHPYTGLPTVIWAPVPFWASHVMHLSSN